MARIALVMATVLGLLAWQPVRVAEPPAPKPVEIVLESGAEPRTLDPHLADDVVSVTQVMYAFETPLEYEPFRPGVLRPCLLASMPTCAEDGVTWTLKLRPDLRFADASCFPDGKGRNATADDLLHSWKRLVLLEQSGMSWILEGVVEDAAEYRGMAHSLAKSAEHADEFRQHLKYGPSGLRVIDQLTLQVKLTGPNAEFVHLLAMHGLALMAPESAPLGVEPLGAPVGTGPFVEDGPLAWRSNPNYREVRLEGVPAGSPLKPFEGARLPLADRVRYVVLPEGEKAAQVLAARGVHRCAAIPEYFVPEAAGRAPATEDLLPRIKAARYAVQRKQEPVLQYISFNMNDEVVGTPAGDKGRALRRALALCVDRERMIRELARGLGTPAKSLTVAGMEGHSARAVLKGQRNDPEEARELLRKAGFKVEREGERWVTRGVDGAQVSIRVALRSTRPTSIAWGELLTEFFAGAGVALKVEAMSFAEFLRLQDEGGGQLYDSGWFADTPTAVNMLQLLHGQNSSPGINSASFRDQGYDERFARLRRGIDVERMNADCTKLSTASPHGLPCNGARPPALSPRRWPRRRSSPSGTTNPST